MDFIFQGFQASLPFWVYMLIFICTFLIAWWSYSNVKKIGRFYYYTLISLRSCVFFILLLLLINPFIKTEDTYYEPANVLVLLDNSASTQIEKNIYQGSESYTNLLQKLGFTDDTNVNYQFYKIGSQVEQTEIDSLTFDADQTNLSLGFETIRANQNDANAAVFISDGIYTTGKNPIYETSNIDIPVFSIGLGDTTFQKDIFVSSISTNSSGYLNSTQGVTTTINSKGFKGSSIPVHLKKGNEILSEKLIVPEIRNSSQEVSFDLLLEQEGLQQYEIHVPSLSNEWTSANNTQRFTVDVQDAKQQILSLALEIHPDVRFIRSLLSTDENTELINRTWLNGDNFMEGDFTSVTDSLDLAIIHGYPSTGLPTKIKEQLKMIVDETPLLVIASPRFNPQQFEQDVSELPVDITGNLNYGQIALSPVPKKSGHPITELPAVTYDQLPYLVGPIENISTSSYADMLFSSNYRGELIQKPVVVTHELGNKRHLFVTAYNWYRFQQDQNPEVQAFVKQLWQNIISWTATDPDNKLLDVQPQQNSFSGSEPIIIEAYLKNERGQNESEANITISISSDTLDDRMYSMEYRDNGNYRLSVPPLPQGIYSYEATAQKGERTMDTDRGEFSVSASNAEYIDINKNEQLLQQIAENTGGEYVSFDSLNGFWNQLEEKRLLERQEQIETNFFYLYQHIGWFIIVIILLSSEWILRKYLSLP
ncbi:hypothetical protein [Fodinibius sp.]|uniref:hypothetical protein n=1 Tax=Fodinibius sp. TaxID=1872440 RepID=UPI002ACED46C|nr:hypothetical protein [Fodinibius sp.]MDZ7660230.1 hypothetical protein [Fodinibius sp.]